MEDIYYQMFISEVQQNASLSGNYEEAFNQILKNYNLSIFHNEELEEIKNKLQQILNESKAVAVPKLSKGLFCLELLFFYLLDFNSRPISFNAFILSLAFYSLYSSFVRPLKKYFKAKKNKDILLKETEENICQIISLLRDRKNMKQAITIDYVDESKINSVTMEYLTSLFENVEQKINYLPENLALLFQIRMQRICGLFSKKTDLGHDEMLKYATLLETIDTDVSTTLEKLHIQEDKKKSNSSSRVRDLF